jgi:hypothetical protein
MGLKLTSVIAYLRTVMRLPVRQIQAYLATLHGLKISSGEIVELLRRAKGHLEPVVTHGALTAPRCGWRSSVSLVPGRLRDSIRSSTAWLRFPSPIL